MSTVAYRLTVYAPRTVDATEATVLTPSAGAPHSDPFKVCTPMANPPAGFKPYIVPEKNGGNRSQLDLLNRVLNVGQWTVRLRDQRVTTGGSNLARWVTAFLGDAKGNPQWLGLKALVEMSLDGGATWTASFTGRVQTADLSSALHFTLTLYEASDDLAVDVFVGRPHATALSHGAQSCRLLPLGFGAAYGPFPATPSSLVVTGFPGAVLVTSAPNPTSNIIVNEVTRLATSVYSGLDLGGGTVQPGTVEFAQRTMRAKIAWTAGALAGSTKEYVVRKLVTRLNTNNQRYCVECDLGALDAADPLYHDPQSIPNNSTYIGTFELYADTAPTAKAPLYINDMHPVQLLKDLLDGFYCTLTASNGARRTFAYDGTLATLIADTTFPTARFVIDKTWSMNEFIEQQICLPFGLGYRINTSGQISVVDLRTVTSASLAGAPTLTDTDSRAAPPAWNHDVASAVTQLLIYSYNDEFIATDIRNISGEYPDVTPTMLLAQQTPWLDGFFGNSQLGTVVQKIDAHGLRSTGFAADTVRGQQRVPWLANIVKDLNRSLRKPFAYGAQVTTIPARHTATVGGLYPGALAIIAMSQMPDPNTNLRGGTRIVRVTDMSEDGVGVSLGITDLGLNSTAATPTVGTPTIGSVDAYHSATVAITLNASRDPVVVQFAITATSVGSRPGASDPLWTHSQIITSTSTAMITGLPSGSRVWVRARSEPLTFDHAYLPSAWVSPATDHVDTTVLPAVTGLGHSGLMSSTVVLAWTVGTTLYPVEIVIDGQRVVLLPAGSASYTVRGLPASTAKTAHVHHVDPNAGTATDATDNFTTTSSAPTAPTPFGIKVVTTVVN